MPVDAKVLAAARAAFPGCRSPPGRSRWARVVHDGQVHPEPLVGLPLAMMNRHGLIAGATGTGKDQDPAAAGRAALGAPACRSSSRT